MDFGDPSKLIDVINTINESKKKMANWEETFSKSKDNEKLLIA